MLTIKLCDNGLDTILKDTMDRLSDVIGMAHSKKEKDNAICEAIGAISALWSLLLVEEVEDKPVAETEFDDYF